ncbi:MAG: hypothetical protein CMN78_06220 [Spirochaetales bacterium]|nr:hypothetical protein [Spirochaetales bacterium]
MVRTALWIIICLFYPTILMAQDDEDRVLSLRTERREIILYGIDSQVLDVIESLKEEADLSLVGDIQALYKTSENAKVKVAVLEYFREIEAPDAFEDALQLVETYQDHESAIVVAALRYLSFEPPVELKDLLIPLLREENTAILRETLKTLGEVGDSETATKLLTYLDDDEFPSEIKPEIILALGDIGSFEAVDRLQEILEDEREDPMWRRYACASLGKINDPTALPVIQRVLFDSDAILRSYAVGALRYFDDPAVESSLVDALRDSFWRVRVSAAQGLGHRKAQGGVPILVFKAKKDPEMNVRVAAVKALGEIGTQDALEALRELYSAELSPHVLRVTSLEILVSQDIDASIEAFVTVISRHWENKNAKILERTAYVMSVTESGKLEQFYSRFLDSGDMTLIIYGIRGVERNRLKTLQDKIESFSREGNHRSIRRAALSALETM